MNKEKDDTPKVVDHRNIKLKKKQIGPQNYLKTWTFIIVRITHHSAKKIEKKFVAWITTFWPHPKPQNQTTPYIVSSGTNIKREMKIVWLKVVLDWKMGGFLRAPISEISWLWWKGHSYLFIPPSA